MSTGPAHPTPASRSQTPTSGDDFRRALERRDWPSLVKQLQARGDQIDDQGRLTLNLARNLARLRRHRPGVCDQLESDPAGPLHIEPYRFMPARCQNGQTLLTVVDPVRKAHISAFGDPVRGVQQAVTELHPYLAAQQAVVLAGFGDGYLLNHCAAHPVAFPLGMHCGIYLLERELTLVRANLMLHDFGPRNGQPGLIEDPRFRWFVGVDCDRRFIDALSREPLLPTPGAITASGPAWEGYRRAVEGAVAFRRQRMDQLLHDNAADYARQAAGDLARWAKAFIDPAHAASHGRPLRVLLLTTRFSTVLRYVTDDVAQALERLGCEAHTLIEAEGIHRISPLAMREAIAAHRPDLIFQLDHHRFEHGDAIPPHIPFINWIQDDLTHLAQPNVAPRLTPRDFTLTARGPIYIRSYGYPARQCIGVDKCTDANAGTDTQRTRANPTDPTAPRSEATGRIVYVSNAGLPPEAVLGRTLQRLRDQAESPPPETTRPQSLQPALTEDDLIHAATRLIARYDEDRFTIYTEHQLGTWLIDDADVQPERAAALARHLWHPLNDALYRQQALRWVRDAAEPRGLELALYGNGWDQHPDFAGHHRGYADYTRELPDITRQAAVNLQIIPSRCLHQRLIDGLAVGGFFLVRQHPADTLIPRWVRFIQRHLPDALDGPIPTADEVRQRLASRPVSATPEDNPCEAFDDLARQSEGVFGLGDPFQAVLWGVRAGYLPDADELLPGLSEVTFSDRDGIAALLDRYIATPHAAADRDRRRGEQRQSVIERFSYEAAMARVLEQVGKRLGDEAEAGLDPIRPIHDQAADPTADRPDQHPSARAA